MSVLMASGAEVRERAAYSVAHTTDFLHPNLGEAPTVDEVERDAERARVGHLRRHLNKGKRPAETKASKVTAFQMRRAKAKKTTLA